MPGRWKGSTRNARLPTNWPTICADVLDRDNHWCRIQGPRCTGRATEVDHVVPGDNHHPSNLQSACRPCHASKSSTEGNAARWGYRQARAPEKHPGLL